MAKCNPPKWYQELSDEEKKNDFELLIGSCPPVSVSPLIGMSDDRWQALMNDDNLPLTEEEMKLKWHFCYEWDGLLVGPGMGEMDSCECFKLTELC